MAFTITLPSTESGYLPSDNPMVFAFSYDYPLGELIVEVEQGTGLTLGTLRIPTDSTTAKVDIAPIVRAYIESVFVNDITTPAPMQFRSIADTDDTNEVQYVRVRAQAADALWQTSGYIKVLQGKARFEETKNLDKFFSRSYVSHYPMAPRLSSAATPNTSSLTASKKSAAYEIGQYDHLALMFPTLMGTLTPYDYICKAYDESGTYKRTHTESNMATGMMALNVPAIIDDYGVQKGWYYETYISYTDGDDTIYCKSVVFHVRDCRHDNYSLLYKSRFGGWWYIPTHLKHFRTLGITTETMELARLSVSAHMRDRRAVAVKGQGQWQLNTDYISKQEHITEIEDMLLSRNIYIMKSNADGVTYIPVTLADSSYSMADRKQDHLVQYTFTLNEAFDE